MRMGMAFVMPTREPKIRFPNTAASLHRALQNPKPVPLGRRNQEEVEESENVLKLIESLCFVVHVSPVMRKSYQLCKPVLYSPPDSREWLSCDHIQGVPGRDAQAVVKAQHENHHGLTGAKPQEETADAWEDHRAAWLTYRHTKRKSEAARVSAKWHSGDWCSTKSSSLIKIASHTQWWMPQPKRESFQHPTVHVGKQLFKCTHKHEHYSYSLHSYLTWTSAQFCPWEGQTQCCQAEQPESQGNWWSKPSKRCSHHQTSSGILSCCGWMCCWPPLCHLSTWIRRCLAKENKKKIQLGNNQSHCSMFLSRLMAVWECSFSLWHNCSWWIYDRKAYCRSSAFMSE